MPNQNKTAKRFRPLCFHPSDLNSLMSFRMGSRREGNFYSSTSLCFEITYFDICNLIYTVSVLTDLLALLLPQNKSQINLKKPNNTTKAPTKTLGLSLFIFFIFLLEKCSSLISPVTLTFQIYFLNKSEHYHSEEKIKNLPVYSEHD